MSSPASKVDSHIDLAAIVGTVPTPGMGVNDKRLSIRAVWTGTLTGTFSLECSFDGGASWDAVPGASAEFTANGNAQPAGGVNGRQIWNFVNVPGGSWRVKYVGTVGTGTIGIKYAWGC